MNLINEINPLINNWYEVYRPHLTRMALMLGYQNDDAEDFVSQFFLDLIEKNIDCETVANPQAYLSTAFKRKLIDHHRRSKSRLYAVTDEILERHKGSDLSAQEKMEQTQYNSDMVIHIRNAFHNLPARCKKVIYLKFYKNLNTEQIALQTGLTKRSVYNNLFEGIKTLRAEMGHSFRPARYAAML